MTAEADATVGAEACPLRYDWPLILGYHSVSDARSDALAVSVSEFTAHMEWLKQSGYASMTLAQFTCRAHDMRPRDRIAILTFDDGYADNYLHAFPVLKR